MRNELIIEGVMMGKEKPELKTWPSGDVYLRLNIMWKAKFRDREKTSFFNVMFYGKMAEKFYESDVWERNKKVLVYGSIISNKAKDGRVFTDIHCNKIEIGKTSKPAAAPASAPQKKQELPEREDPEHTEVDLDEVQDDEEEIPF